MHPEPHEHHWNLRNFDPSMLGLGRNLHGNSDRDQRRQLSFCDGHLHSPGLHNCRQPDQHHRQRGSIRHIHHNSHRCQRIQRHSQPHSHSIIRSHRNSQPSQRNRLRHLYTNRQRCSRGNLHGNSNGHERIPLPHDRNHHSQRPRLHHHCKHNIYHDQCGCIRNSHDHSIPRQRVHRNSYSNDQPERWSNSHRQPHQYHWRLRHVNTHSHRSVRRQLHGNCDRNKRLSISHDISHIGTSSRLPDIRQPNHRQHHSRSERNVHDHRSASQRLHRHRRSNNNRFAFNWTHLLSQPN